LAAGEQPVQVSAARMERQQKRFEFIGHPEANPRSMAGNQAPFRGAPREPQKN